MVPGMVLVDGFVAGTWRAETARRTARLHVDWFARPGAADRHAVVEEGLSLLRLLAPESDPDRTEVVL
jgi:hypothetical protein